MATSSTIIFLLSSLAILALAAQQTEAVDFFVTNRAASTAGGIRFTNEIGLQYAHQIQAASTDLIWRVFQEASSADRRNISTVNLYIDTMDGIAYTENDETHVSADYIGNYSGDVKTEFAGVLFHEMTHVWQWFGNGAANGGLIEGIADFVRLRAGLAPSHWVKPGEGDSWDQGYDVTARFLDYCTSLRQGFVAEINKKMREGYSDDFFIQLLGKPVNQIWSDYKAKYDRS